MVGQDAEPEKTAISRLPDVGTLPLEDRYEIGRSRRGIVPRSAHAEWSPPPERDIIALLDASNKGRTETLVPIRHGRMLASSFAFYRGAPAVMAFDLAHTPSSGIIVQLCGDCHIGNLGLFASPERALVFDLNDFDETLPGPFEWDVKRAAASIVVAAQNAGLTKKDAEKAVRMALRVYRDQMAEFATRSYLQTWYSRVEANVFLEMAKKEHRQTVSAQLAKVQEKDRLKAFAKLTDVVDGRRRIVHDPPLIYRLDVSEERIREAIRELFTAYYESLEDSRKRLLSRYRFVDLAHKVVGVGSVGTHCFISLCIGIDEGDPLFLQVKQARPSILEPYLGRSEYDHPGQRVITGQRLMQATNDIFLGHGQMGGEAYFIRQLYDMKGSTNLESMPAFYLERYAGLCGAVLARAHARSGDAAQIAGYLGKSDRFDQALVSFAFRYAEQNDADWQLLKQAVKDGRLAAKIIEEA
jgi:uncharacterized protein (DUF2252 family)